MDISVTSRITPEMLYAFYKYQVFRGETKKPVVWIVLSSLIVAASVVFFVLWGFDPMMLAALIVSVLMLFTVLYLRFLSPYLKYRKAMGKKDKTVPVRASYHFMRYGFTASVEYGDGTTGERRCDYLSLWFAAELGDSLCLCFSPDDALMLRKEAMTKEELEILEDAIIAARNPSDLSEEK